jgi:hypothetical protein
MAACPRLVVISGSLPKDGGTVQPVRAIIVKRVDARRAPRPA